MVWYRMLTKWVNYRNELSQSVWYLRNIVRAIVVVVVVVVVVVAAVAAAAVSLQLSGTVVTIIAVDASQVA